MSALFILANLLFALPLQAGPVVFWASDPVRPDDTVLVAGSGFGEKPVVRLLTLRNGISGQPGANWLWPKRKRGIELSALQPSDESLKFVIPARLKLSAWLFRVETADGDSKPVLLNCPTIYWNQGDIGNGAASPGGWVRLFGRNVSRPGAKLSVWLRRAGRGNWIKLSPRDSSLWAATASIPKDMPAGRWEVFVHNGFGREFGWSRAGNLNISPHEKWPSQVFNVRDCGATGKGVIEDTLGIEQALEKARKAGGGVVYLPRGRYRMEHTLELPPWTVLRGEARELVSIFWPDTEAPCVLVQGTHHFGIEDVTLYASNYTHAIAGSLDKPDSGHVFVRRVRIRADLYRGHLKPEQVDKRMRASLALSSGGGDTIRLGGPGIEVSDCDLYGSGRSIFLLKARGARVVNNRLYNGRWGWYCFAGPDGLIFENNVLTGADLMSSGGGIDCLYGATYAQNVYYAGNTIALCHGWDREAMTTDAGGGAYHGPVAEATADSLVLPKKGTWRGAERWKNGGVFILGGPGMGQYRQIQSIAEDEKTITLDRPWQVIPDQNSLITVTMMHQNYLFINNHFEDAGIALQYYGTSINHVASGNTSTRSGGFYNSGRWYRHYQPSWYCQFFENEILEGNGYRFGPNNATRSGDSFLGTFGLQRGDNPAPLAYCSIHRRNRLRNNAVIRLIGVSEKHPGVRDVIVEHNLVEQANAGVFMDRGCVGVLFRKNSFKDVLHKRYGPDQLRKKLMEKRAKLLAQAQPVYYQSFDHVAGRLFPDDSGHGFIATERAGKVITDEGISGKAGVFDGEGYLVVNDRQMLRFPRLTIAAWVRPELDEGRWGVAGHRTTGGSTPYVLAIRHGGVTFEGTDTRGNWSYNFYSKRALKPGEWNFVAATCEESKQVRVYCNGQQVGERKVQLPLVENQQALTIGYEAWGGFPESPHHSGNFRGLIDELKIWSRILSPDEIKAEYEKLAGAAAKDTKRRKEEQHRRDALLEKMKKDLRSPGGVPWRMAVAETFDHPLGKEWLTLRGIWSVRAGTLHCNSTSFLAYARPVKAPVRIEFDARSNRPGDLTGFWGTRKNAYRGGYFIGFASNGNTANKILRLNQQVAQNDAPLAAPGKWHHVIAQVLKDRVQLIVDGKLALEFKDRKPVRSADTAGILAWSEAEFDNLRIYTE